MNNKLNKIFIGFVITSCVGFSACKKKMPSDVLSKGDMEDVLVDYHIAKAMSENLPVDERYKEALYMDYVYQKNGTTKDAFDHSLEWYSRNTDDFAKIYEKVIKRLASKREDIKTQIAEGGDDEQQQQSETGDVVNVWHKQKIYKLTKAPASNKFYFTILPDANYKERDALQWNLRCTFISARNNQQEAVMGLTIKYVNDSIISDTRNITSTGLYNIRIQNNSSCKIGEIKGFVYYTKNSGYPQDALIVDNIALTRYHANGGAAAGHPTVSTTTPVNQPVPIKDSVLKPGTKPAPQQVQPVNLDSLNRIINSGMPRRRSAKNKTNDVRILRESNQNQNQTPQGIKK